MVMTTMKWLRVVAACLTAGCTQLLLAQEPNQPPEQMPSSTITVVDGNTEGLNMFVGEVKVLQVGAVEHVAVGNGKLLSTSALKNGQLVLLGEGEGTTTLHIWQKNGQERNITVVIGKVDTKRGTADLQALLRDIPGVTARDAGGRMVLSGNVDPADQPLLDTVLKMFPDLIDMTRKKPPILAGDKMVYMDVKITEFNTNALETLGIDWDNPINGPSAGFAADVASNNNFRITPDSPSFKNGLPLKLSGASGYFGLVTEISSRLNFLVNSGDAVLLAQPRLSARSGGTADFLAGGEIPLKTTSSLGQSNVQFKEFGIKLGITPLVDDLGNIVAKVYTEVSAIDPATTVDGIPGFLTRKTSTDIRLKDRETLVISGLMSQQASKDLHELKWLGELPVLGALFRSTNFRDNKSELVIFVTPTVYDATSDLNKERVERRKQLIDKFRKAVDQDDLQLLE
ncbi:MAG TPA: pilus assembly protein N-terminal domain-containing protein [Gammaproteobacteria bacterium]|nr:pilus assembly protein N-terminal domain-containing protein [Gammaproteobacteria bacterium]